MALTLLDAAALSTAELAALPAAEFDALQLEHAAWLRRDAQANQLVYYRLVNPAGLPVHTSTAREVAIQGGNKSGKTGTILAELAIQLTKIVPRSLEGVYPRSKLKPGPIRARLVVTSLTSAWDTNLKPKLQFWEWSGRPNGAGLLGDPDIGHWGWIPQRCLINGDWAQSWSEKHRVLTLVDGSKLFVMSHDQDIQEFNQGAFDVIAEDEIPPETIHRANRLRIMERGGQILIGGTPSDDRVVAAAAHAWYFDQILEPGLARSNPAEVEACVLWTEHNRTLDAANVEYVARGLSPEQRRARLHGEAIHLGGLIFPTFTIHPKTWCFTCHDETRKDGARCSVCGSSKLTGYSHVWDDGDLEWPGPRDWPTVFYMDPHQSKPTACAWYKVDPEDNWWQFAEAEITGSAEDVKRECLAIELEAGVEPLWRMGDPKITAQTNQFAKEYEGQAFTIRRAFEEVGFDFLDANTNFSVARERLLSALQVQPLTRVPRFRVHRTRCPKTAYQFTRFTWNEQKTPSGKDQPGRLHSDFPACHDAETEVLTDRGWRLFAELDRRALVATVDALGRLEYQEPTDYIDEAYSGDLVVAESRALNFAVTPNHVMLTAWTSNENKWRTMRRVTADTLKRGQVVPVAPARDDADAAFRVTIPGMAEPVPLDDWAEFLGWFVSEGHTSGNKGGEAERYEVAIAQQPGPKYDRIAALVKRLPMHWQYGDRWVSTQKLELWHYLHKLGNVYTKRLPDAVFSWPMSALERLWEAMILGDGTVNAGQRIYITASPWLADDVTRLLTTMGRAWSKSERKRGESEIRGQVVRPTGPIYNVSERQTRFACLENGEHRNLVHREAYEGRVYCVTVPNGTLVTRRGGRPLIAGNCARYLAMSDPTWTGCQRMLRPEPLRLRQITSRTNRQTGW